MKNTTTSFPRRRESRNYLHKQSLLLRSISRIKSGMTRSGFTLVEILVATLVIAAISVVTTNLLFDTVTARSSQYAISGASDEVRLLIDDISKSVQEAGNVSIPDSNTLKIRADVCKSIRWDATNQKLEQATDNSATCVPPTTGFTQISSDNIEISSFVLSPIAAQTDTVNMQISGIYKSANGSHDFDYSTTIFARVGI